MLRLFIVFFALQSFVTAADPELIPLKPTSPPTASYECTAYLRQSMYDRWQYYAVDRTGNFRPRVVLNFPEPYYLVNGRTFPLLTVEPRAFIPYVTD